MRTALKDSEGDGRRHATSVLASESLSQRLRHMPSERSEGVR